MRTTYCCLFILFFSRLNAQVQENFETVDFTTNSSWMGDTPKWTVDNGLLRSNSTTDNDVFFEHFANPCIGISSSSTFGTHCIATAENCPVEVRGQRPY